jgi:hypothetical protein
LEQSWDGPKPGSKLGWIRAWKRAGTAQSPDESWDGSELGNKLAVTVPIPRETAKGQEFDPRDSHQSHAKRRKVKSSILLPRIRISNGDGAPVGAEVENVERAAISVLLAKTDDEIV